MARTDRVQEELRQQVSLIVQQELKDPRIGFVTITRAEITPDLKQATVYFTNMDAQGSRQDSAEALNRAAGFIRKLIGERMRMRFTPKITFVYDDSFDRRDRIEEIIREIKREKEE